MKRILSIVFCVALILTVFVSCNGNNNEETTTEPTTTAEETTTPVAQPDKDYTLTKILEKDYSQYIEYGQYKGIEIDVNSAEYLDLRQQYIESALLQNGFVSEYENRAVASGDTVNIDFTGYMDGEAFEGGSAEGQDLIIGSHSFIDDFEDQLIGHMPGDEVDVTVTFPTPYQNNPDFAGKEALFKVKINHITSAPIYPDITKDKTILKECFKVDTVQELYDSLKEDLSKQLAYDKAMSTVNVISYPEDELAEMKADVMKSVESAAESYGVTVEEYLEAVGVDVDEYVKEQLKDQMYYFEILRNEPDGPYSEEEYLEMFEDFAKESGYDDWKALFDSVSSYYGSEEEAMYSLAMYLLPNKAISIIVDSVVVVG